MKRIITLSLITFSISLNRMQLLSLRLSVKAILTLFVIFQFAALSTNAQEYVWAKKAGSRIFSMIDDKSNSVIVGDLADFVTFEDLRVENPDNFKIGSIFFGKYSPSGTLKYMYTNHDTGSANFISADLDSKGNLYFLGSCEGDITIGGITINGGTYVNSYFLAKIDTAGQPVWIKTFSANYIGNQDELQLFKVACDQEDNIFISGTAYSYILDGIPLWTSGSSTFFAKLDKQNGTAIWAGKVIAPEGKVGILDFAFDPNNNVYLSGDFTSDFTFEGGIPVTKTPNTIHDAYLCKYDKNGVFKWISQSPENPDVSSIGLNFSDSNHLSYVFSDRINYYDTTGQLMSQYNDTTNCRFTGIAKDKHSDYLSVFFKDQFAYGSTIVEGSDSDGNGLIIKLDPSNGTLLWHTSPTEYIDPNYLTSNQKGLLQFSGQGQSVVLHLGNHQLLRPVVLNSNYLHEWGFNAMISDTSFNTGSNIIHGKIFNDTIADCQWDNEPELKGFTVIAEPGPYFAVSDSLGNYELKVDTGNYFISNLIPNNHTFIDTASCPSDSIPVYFAGQNSLVLEQNFGEKYQHCSLLTLDAADVTLYLGQTNTQYTLTVCNEGQDTVTNAILSLKYPGNISFPILSNPQFSGYNTLDSTLTISLGNLPPQSCVSINIMDSIVQGNIERDRLYKYQISITPKNICYLSDSVYSKKDFNLSMVSPVNIGEIAGQRKPVIFPNPSDGAFYIKGIKQNSELKVYDITGREIESFIKSNDAVITIVLNDQPDGIYIISLKNEKQNNIYKVVKSSKK